MPRAVSMYQNLWEHIKKDASSKHPVGVAISQSSSAHAKVIKAIQHRKLVDSAYKFQMAEEGKNFMRLMHTVEGKKITFWLEVYSEPMIGEL